MVSDMIWFNSTAIGDDKRQNSLKTIRQVASVSPVVQWDTGCDDTFFLTYACILSIRHSLAHVDGGVGRPSNRVLLFHALHSGAKQCTFSPPIFHPIQPNKCRVNESYIPLMRNQYHKTRYDQHVEYVCCYLLRGTDTISPRFAEPTPTYLPHSPYRVITTRRYGCTV